MWYNATDTGTAGIYRACSLMNLKKMVMILFKFSIAKLGKTTCIMRRETEENIPLIQLTSSTLSTHIAVCFVDTMERQDHVARGLCPHQCHYPMGCQAKIMARYGKLQNKIVVRDVDINHNHRTGSDVVRHYPFARRLNKTDQKEVEEIIGL